MLWWLLVGGRAAFRRGVRVVGQRRLSSSSAPMMMMPGGSDGEDSSFVVRFETADGVRVLEGVRRGELVRTALLKRGVSPHNGRSQLINCRGLGTCGTCAVELAGAVEPSAWTAVESVRLNFPPHSAPSNSKLRLACQCVVDGDVTLKKRRGFWGSGRDGDGLASAAVATTYLGDLEFVLDAKSPPSSTTCAVCRDTEVVACPNCDGLGCYAATGGSQVTCKACSGSGQQFCRSCFKGDPFNLDALRARAKRRPD